MGAMPPSCQQGLGARLKPSVSEVQPSEVIIIFVSAIHCVYGLYINSEVCLIDLGDTFVITGGKRDSTGDLMRPLY